MIPTGKVASYGQVAELAGMPGRARWVGRVLAELPGDTNLPWHRVVNASLRLALAAGSAAATNQRRRLHAEGVEFIGARIAPGCRWSP